MDCKLFLRWLLFGSIMFLGTVITYALGGFDKLDEWDFTKLSFLILAIFFIMSAWCGKLTWDASWLMEQKPSDYIQKLQKIENQAEHGWFSTTACEMLGLVGTLVGMTKLIGSFQNFQFGQQETIATSLEQFAYGFGTAIITTLVGTVCSILLRIQYHHLTNAIDGVKNEQA